MSDVERVRRRAAVEKSGILLEKQSLQDVAHFRERVGLCEQSEMLCVLQKHLRPVRGERSKVGWHAALKQPQVAYVPEPSLRLVTPQHRNGVSRVPAAAALPLALLVLLLERSLPFVVDVREELGVLRTVLVDLSEHEGVEPPAKSRPRVELASCGQDDSVHIPEPDLPLVEFLEEPHS